VVVAAKVLGRRSDEAPRQGYFARTSAHPQTHRGPR
jgi:hypothetical protein